MSQKLNEGTGSSFLKNLQQAVNSGDPNKGKDAIQKINEIHKLAENKVSEGMDAKIAEASIDKRIEEAGEKEALTVEERELVSLESEREKIKREKEEARLTMLVNIENANYEIEQVKKEFEEIKIQYNTIIQTQEDEVNVLKIKYEARFGEEENDG